MRPLPRVRERPEPPIVAITPNLTAVEVSLARA
jgi:hypothetical protein